MSGFVHCIVAESVAQKLLGVDYYVDLIEETCYLLLIFYHQLSERIIGSMPMKKVKFRFKESDELISSNAGLALTGLLLDKTKLDRRISETDLPSSPHPIIGKNAF